MLSKFPQLKLSCCLVALAASGFQGFGMYHVHSFSGVTEGGILGLVLFFEHWLSISPAVSSLVLNCLCYLLGWRVLGKNFIGYSLVAALGYSVSYGICEQFPPLWPGIADYPLVASVLGALFVGIGAGLCIRAGGAVCGDDALAMSFRALIGLDVEKLYLITDLSVLALALTYIPAERMGYSLLTVILSGQIIGWIQKIPFRKRKTVVALGPA